MRTKSSQGAYRHSVREYVKSNDVDLPVVESKALYSWQNYREEDGPVHFWRDKIRSGDSASTYMRAWKSEDPKVISGYIENRAWHTSPNNGPVNRYYYSGDLAPHPGFGAVVPSNIDALYNSALIAIHQKIKAEQTKMSGLVFAGEAREALQLIRNPARAIANATYSYLGNLHNWRRTHGRAGPKAYRDKLSESWLNYSFGIKPLVNDVQDGAKALANVLTGGSRKTRVSHEWIIGEERTVSPQTSFNVMGRDSAPATLQSITITKAYVRWICGIRSRPEGPDTTSLVNSSFGLTLNDFVPTAWELLPWSFLADYFTNIGDVLEAVCTDTSSVTWSLRQTRLETTRLNTAWGDEEAAAAWFGAQFVSSKTSSSSIETKSTEYRRDVIGLDRPSFQVRVNLNANKVANMAALGTLYRGLLPFGR